MTPATSVYSQSSSQPSAGYRPTQVNSPRGSSSQPSAGYLPPQDYSPRGYSQPLAGIARHQRPSFAKFVPGAAPAADPGISAAGVPVAQHPIVEPTGGYGYPQDSKTMYPQPGKSGVAGSTAESAGSQYSTHLTDPYNDRGMYRGM